MDRSPNEWLEVTVHADPNTGLIAPYTFFYGSRIGNSGTGNTGALAITSSTDENAARIPRRHCDRDQRLRLQQGRIRQFVRRKRRADQRGATIKFIKIAANTPLAPDASPAVAPDLNLAPTVTADTKPPGQPAAATGHRHPTDQFAEQSQCRNAYTVAARCCRVTCRMCPRQRRGRHDLRGPGRGRHETDPPVHGATDKVADAPGIDNPLLDSIMVELGLEEMTPTARPPKTTSGRFRSRRAVVSSKCVAEAADYLFASSRSAV